MTPPRPARELNKQEVIKDFLLSGIRNGRLKPGDLLYSRPVFMKKFACARGTVDLALQSLTRAGVLTSQKGKGTFVAFQERGPGSGHAAVVTHTRHAVAWTHAILHGIMTGIGSDRTVRSYSYDDLKHPAAWEECKEQSVILFLLPDAENEPLLAEARLKKIPHLAVYRDPPESPFVAMDNVGGAARLVDALARAGAKRIAFAAWRQSRYHFAEQIYTGFLEGLLRNGLPLDKALTGLCSVGREDALLKRIFGAGEPPDALLFYGPPLPKILAAGRTRKLEPGKSLMLCDYNYTESGALPFPILSPLPVEEKIGAEAAHWAVELIKNPEAFPQVYIQPAISTVPDWGT